MQIANVTNQDSNSLEWQTINWRAANDAVNNLRRRIYRASTQSNYKIVRNLQRLLLKSTANKLLSIRRVTQQNHGRYTPGVDKVIIDTDKGRENLYRQLTKSTTYNPHPVKRVYIPKKNGKNRPLGLPSIIDRCWQAIVKSALEPYWEAKFEATSYGFRPGRSAHDAIQKIFCIARAGKSRQWVLDADIKSAYDCINHSFLMKLIKGFPGRSMIYKWLKAGVMENNCYSPTEVGTPQGGIISPLLANIAFHGMENALGIEYWKDNVLKLKCPYMLVRYADDFVVFAKSQVSCLEAKEKLQHFLAERGLQLSEEKTHVRHLTEGFDFLGFNIKHYATRGKKRGYVLLCKPSKMSVRSYKQQMKQVWKSVIGIPTESAIKLLNSKIIGWCNYFRIGSSKRTFSVIDNWMFWRQIRFLARRHPNKQWWWWKKHYFGMVKGRQDRWVFKDTISGNTLWKHAWTKIKRHTLVKGKFSPDDPTLQKYWRARQANKSVFLYGIKPILARKQKGICLVCRQPLDNGELLHVHHIIAKALGGNDKVSNLCLLHKACHRQIHSKFGHKVEVSKLLEPYAG